MEKLIPWRQPASVVEPYYPKVGNGRKTYPLPTILHINKVPLKIESLQTGIRAKVEHPFRINKCQFGFTRTRYRGLNKSDNKLAMLFSLANVVCGDQLLRA